MTDETDVRRRLGDGRYRIDGSLGRGGMSEVFFGYDERLDRRVAIKLLKPAGAPVPSSPEAAELLSEQARDRTRFLREIRTTAQLELAGAPAVYDTGVETAADGSTQLWLVMQLLRGSTLESLLDRTDYGPVAPSVSWAAAIAAQIAAVLSDVHRVDIVHRDIKPANVMIVDGGLVKVLDFGIAILRGAGALPRLTQVDHTVGTPPYMSPEQCIGLVVTAASDIYSLGCLLFELLTGDQPFHDSADVSLRAHHLRTPAPSVRARRADVPDDVDALLISMLAKDPADRPTAEAVYDALVAFADSGSSGDDERDPTRPFRRPLLRPPPREQASGERIPLTDDEFDTLWRTALALLDDERPAEAIRILEAGVERVGNDPYIDLRLRHFLAGALFSAEEYSRAAPLFDAVGRDYRQRVETATPEVLDCSYHAGQAYAAVGKPQRALPHLRFYLHHADPDHREQILDTRFAIARMLATEGQPVEAVAELRAVRPVLVEQFGAASTQVRNLDRQIGRLTST